MRFFIVPLLTVMLFVVPDANAFIGCIARAAGGMGNINSGTCGGAGGLWSSYCSGGGHTGYSYGSGFGAYAFQIPPSPSCGGGCGSGCGNAGVWYGCGQSSCGGGCSLGGCGGGSCNLGTHLRGLMNRLRSRCCSAGCCSAGASWVGGGPLDSYTVAPASSFDGGIDYGYINTCSSGGCGGGGCGGGGCGGGGCSAGGDEVSYDAGGHDGGDAGTVVTEPTPAVEGGAAIEGPFNHAG